MRISTIAIIAGLGFSLAACGGSPGGRTLYSAHQPVITRDNYVLDVNVDSVRGIGGDEERRTIEWFDALGLGYGDRISVDFGNGYYNAAVRSRIADLAAARGMLLTDTAPVTNGAIAPGTVRVIVTRSSASVPGCPDWTHTSESNFTGSNGSNYGCAVNSNYAAMVADPEDLVRGSDQSGANIKQSNKAIDAYRKKPAVAGTTTKVE